MLDPGIGRLALLFTAPAAATAVTHPTALSISVSGRLVVTIGANDDLRIVEDVTIDPRAPLSPDDARKLRPAPSDLSAWLRSRPYVTSVSERPVTVGGHAGHEIAAQVGALPGGAPCPNTRPCVVALVAIKENSIGSIVFFENDTTRLILLEVEGSRVLVVARSHPTSDEVLASLRFLKATR